MDSTEILVLIITLFAAPIGGMVLGLCNKTNSRKLKLLRFIFSLVLFCSSSALFLYFTLHQFKGSAEIILYSLDVFKMPVSLVIQPINVVTALIISSFFLLMRFSLLIYLKKNSFTELSSGNYLVQNIDVFGHSAILGLLLINFASSSILMLAGLFILSISFTLLRDSKDSDSIRTFRINIFIDFLFVISIVFAGKASEILISMVLFVALLFKLALPPTCWHRKIPGYEIRTIFLVFVRPTLLFLMLQHFAPMFFANHEFNFVILLVVALILLHSLISLYKSVNSLEIIEEVSNFSITTMFLVSIFGHFETSIMHFAGILASNTLFALILLSNAGQSNESSSGINGSSRFNLDNFRLQSGKSSVFRSFFILSIFSIAGALPLIGGWVNVQLFMHLRLNFFENVNLIRLIAFIVLNCAFFLILFVFGRVFTLNFSKHAELGKQSQKSSQIPLILLALSVIVGGIINLPGNTSISNFLTRFIIDDAVFSSKIGISEIILMILLVLAPVIIFVASVFIHRKHKKGTTLKALQKFDIIRQLQFMTSKIQEKSVIVVKSLADFSYVVIERVLIQSIFILIGRFFSYAVKILRNDLQTHEQPHPPRWKFMTITSFVFIVIVLLVIIALRTWA